MSKDTDILQDAQDAFQRSVEAENDNRARALEDVRFGRLGEQWPDKVRQDRERDNRPCLTINRLPAFARQVVNDARQNRPMISVSAVDNYADPKTAEILGGIIRHIERNSDADIAYDTAIEWAIYGGFGYWTVDADYASDDGFEQELFIRRVPDPFSIFSDPDSETGDSSDWRVAFQVTELTEEAFEEAYGKAEKSSWGESVTGFQKRTESGICVAKFWQVEKETKQLVLLNNGAAVLEDDLKGDKLALMQAMGIAPTPQKRKLVQSKVRYSILSGAEVLEEGEWKGRYIPIVPVYGDEVMVDGKRHFRSLIRDAVDAQRMFNYWRTVSTELVALAPKAPYIGAKGAFKTDARKWNRAHVDTYGFIEYDPTPGEPPPQRQPFAGPPAGALQEALNASDDMKSIMGIYDASLGARSNEISGRAIMARQREGDVSTFHFMDNRNRAIRHTGRILLDLIPKYYDTERVIRILGKDESAQQVTVNQEQVDPLTGEVQKALDLTVGRYDVSVKAGPSFTSQREEAAAQMTELFRAMPDAAMVLGDLWAKMQDWPFADEIAQRLAGLQQQSQQQSAPQPAPPDPNKQIDVQIKQVDLQIEQIKLEVEKVKAQATLAKAESDRAAAVASAMQPQQPPQIAA